MKRTTILRAFGIFALIAVIAVGSFILWSMLRQRPPIDTVDVPVEVPFVLPAGPFVISEIAWMGGETNHRAEWIELYNGSPSRIELDGWTVRAEDLTPNIALSGYIDAGEYWVSARGTSPIAGVSADARFADALGNDGEHLQLVAPDGTVVDEVEDWYAGSNRTKATMSRRDPREPGTDPLNWFDAAVVYAEGFGSPGRANGPAPELTERAVARIEAEQADRVAPTREDCREHIHQVSEDPGAINVYFNKSAATDYAWPADNKANYNVDLEARLIYRLRQAEKTIDLAAYEINLDNIVATLVLKAATGVRVRAIIDSKVSDDPHYKERFERVRALVERMVRGIDGRVGTADDIAVFSDSPIFALEDPVTRAAAKLPPKPDVFPYVTYAVARDWVSGYLLAEGEARDRGTPGYYSPRTQMHNKFAVVDGQWVFTGSWNFTLTGLYGDEASRERGCMNGNQQHVVEINHAALAAQYVAEFNEMWGGEGRVPSPELSNFNTRKADNTVHHLDIGGRSVESYFSPSDKAVDRLAEIIRKEAGRRVYFSIFAWSDQAVTDALKVKWEGSPNDLEGLRTGFEILGLFDHSFTNQWWSASIDMTGRDARRVSEKNPNIRWRHPAPVLSARESRKLHSKTMIIDGDVFDSDPTVIIGATNWSQNGDDKNDENMLVIRDARIANLFVQEFYARYRRAGGIVPPPRVEIATGQAIH